MGVITIPVDHRSLRTHLTNGANSTTKVKDDTFVASQLRNALDDSKNRVRMSEIGNAIPYIIWQDFWNKHSLFGRFYDQYNYEKTTNRYARGSKVHLQFGIGIDKETSMPHPGIVLYDFPQSMIVAPTTSDDGNLFSNEIKKGLIYCQGDGTIFPKDTIINLHQIRVVSKNRIINDLRCNVKDYILPNNEIDSLNQYLPYAMIEHNSNLLDVIEIKLAHLFSPSTLFNLKDLTDEVEQLKKEKEDLEEKLRKAEEKQSTPS